MLCLFVDGCCLKIDPCLISMLAERNIIWRKTEILTRGELKTAHAKIQGDVQWISPNTWQYRLVFSLLG